MQSSSLVAATILAFSAIATPAFAGAYSDAFPSDTSTFEAPDGRYFYFVGHKVSESFTGTGLASVSGIDLSIPFMRYALREELVLTLSINGIDVGLWNISSGLNGDATAELSFDFAEIVGSGDYTLMLRVTDPVCGGCGSIDLRKFTGLFTLYDNKEVPEPAALALFGLGLAGLGVMRRRKSA